MPQSFDSWMRERQIEWRKAHIKQSDWGWQNGKQYEWILPAHAWEEGLWRSIRSGTSSSLPRYLREKRIQKHRGVHNLKSSWIAAANLYFPFGSDENGRALLASFMKEHVDIRVETVDAVELEYAEDGALHPSILLGEEGGMRGAGQTSPDLAFIVNSGRGLILTENKLVEHSFYRCSARAKRGSTDRPGNPNPARCHQLPTLFDNLSSVCHQCVWGRKYWDLLLHTVDRSLMLSLTRCPAASTGYQLVRQQALAEGMACSGKYSFVISSVATDERNTVLLGCLRRTGIKDIKRDWPRLFVGKAGFTLFTHQQWVNWVRRHDPLGVWHDWLQYVSARYGY